MRSPLVSVVSTAGKSLSGSGDVAAGPAPTLLQEEIPNIKAQISIRRLPGIGFLRHRCCAWMKDPGLIMRQFSQSEEPGTRQGSKVHPAITRTITGPRAVLGSQQPATRSDVRTNCAPDLRSDALRAKDGSRSVPFGPGGIPIGIDSFAMGAHCLRGYETTFICRFSHEPHLQSPVFRERRSF